MRDGCPSGNQLWLVCGFVKGPHNSTSQVSCSHDASFTWSSATVVCHWLHSVVVSQLLKPKETIKLDKNILGLTFWIFDSMLSRVLVATAWVVMISSIIWTTLPHLLLLHWLLILLEIHLGLSNSPVAILIYWLARTWRSLIVIWCTTWTSWTGSLLAWTYSICTSLSWL